MQKQVHCRTNVLWTALLFDICAPFVVVQVPTFSYTIFRIHINSRVESHFMAYDS